MIWGGRELGSQNQGAEGTDFPTFSWVEMSAQRGALI